MKTAKFIAKLAVALAAVAGAVYVIATYGNQIVAWCKKILASLPSCQCEEAEAPAAEEAEVVEEVAVEEIPVEEVPAAEEPAAEEVPAAEEPAAEEVPAAEEPVAEESDFDPIA